MRWITLAPLALFALASAACGAPSAGSSAEPLGTTSQPIYGGTVDDDGTANLAVVALTVASTAGQLVLCTATLIAPNVVLTAHHCVASSVAATVTCDQNGLSTSGTQVGADVDPTTLHVFTGAHPDLAFGTPDANGTAIFDTESPALCNSDVAVVILDRPIPTITPLPVRLASATHAGERVRAVGYGQNDQGAPTGTRFRRDGLTVLATGPAISASGTALGSSEIELGASTCEGDSGGPAISEETGAVVGVVSRAGACTDDFGHVYTLTSGSGALITRALAAAGQQPLEEILSTDGGPTNAAPQPPHGSAPGTGSAVAQPDAGETSGVTRRYGAIGGYPQGSCAATVAPGRSGGASAAAILAGILATALARRRRRI